MAAAPTTALVAIDAPQALRRIEAGLGRVEARLLRLGPAGTAPWRPVENAGQPTAGDHEAGKAADKARASGPGVEAGRAA